MTEGEYLDELERAIAATECEDCQYAVGGWTGQIDGAEIHDYALTPEEIAALQGKAQMAWRAPDGKIAYWPKDDPPLIHKPPTIPQRGY